MKLYPVEPPSRVEASINGAYRILSKLAEGGMGEVFLAEQIAVQRHVALKMLRRDKLGGVDLKEAAERFEREALAMSRLRHPNTVQLIDFGVDNESGSYYLVLELLSGKAMNVLLAEQGALTPTRAARIGVQIARALEEAHRHGIVHRDLKPDNVLLCEFDGASDFVKVLDFGIAISPATPMSKRLTSRSEILGSPYYMAPEQVRAQAVSFPADVFSMGVLLYESLSGVPPFEGTSVIETMYRRLDGPPPPLRLARASDVRLEAAWDDLVKQMLRLEPSERPTIGEVRARLEDLRLWVPGARAPLGVKPAPAPKFIVEPEDREALVASGMLHLADAAGGADDGERQPIPPTKRVTLARPVLSRPQTRRRGPSLTPGVGVLNALTAAPGQPQAPVAEPPALPPAVPAPPFARAEAPPEIEPTTESVFDFGEDTDLQAPAIALLPVAPRPDKRGWRPLAFTVTAAAAAVLIVAAISSSSETPAHAAGHGLATSDWPSSPRAAGAPLVLHAPAAPIADPFAVPAGDAMAALALPVREDPAPTEVSEAATSEEDVAVDVDLDDEPPTIIAPPIVTGPPPTVSPPTPPRRVDHRRHPKRPPALPALPGFRAETGARTVHE